MEIADNMLQRVVEQIRKRILNEEILPLKISIMGQTGVGKSSLINALFKTKLDTSAIRPGTEKIERVVFKKANHELWFYDLPGIGESIRQNAQALAQYTQMFRESDIVLWAIHADSRSFSFDLDALHQIFESISKTNQAQLMSKITFVLTKVDLLTPGPWILSKYKKSTIFVPHKATQRLLEQKEAYFQEVFLLPYEHTITSQTYYTGDFSIEPPIPQISRDLEKGMIYYRGFFDKDELALLKKQYPKLKSVLDRLQDNYRIIPCSSRFRFNLDLLMRVIINKLGSDAVTRFTPFFDSKILSHVPLTEAKTFCNLVVFDEDKKRLVFDLSRSKIWREADE